MVRGQRRGRIVVAGALALAILTWGTVRDAVAKPLSPVHLVVPGDTLSEIAEDYGISLDVLATVNGIADENRIYAGDQLSIPDGSITASASTVVTVPARYLVRDGDTLEGIAASLGTTPASLLRANPEIDDPDLLFAGQSLRIPGLAGGVLAPPRVPRAEVAALLTRYALRYDLDPALVQALAWQESGWQQDAVSPSGAIGVMQILPETGAWVGAEIVGRPLDIAGSATDNILAGVALLDWLIDRSGSEEHALSLYVQGQGSVARVGILPETQAYLDNVLAIRDFIVRYGAPPPP